MVLNLNNGRAVGQVFPPTADKAYIIANDWKSSSARVAHSRETIASGAVFMLTDEVRALAIVPSPVPRIGSPDPPGETEL